MAINDKDINKLKGIFTTKQDFESFKKEAWETFATKQDLEKFVTKVEFKQAISGINKSLDWLMGKMEMMLNEFVLFNRKVNNHDDKFQNHDKRIIALESLN